MAKVVDQFSTHLLDHIATESRRQREKAHIATEHQVEEMKEPGPAARISAKTEYKAHGPVLIGLWQHAQSLPSYESGLILSGYTDALPGGSCIAHVFTFICAAAQMIRLVGG